jgi:hypothetical protein
VLLGWKVRFGYQLRFHDADSNVVGESLVRYVNSGVTLGSVNLPEVNLRSLTVDEPNHARVSCVLIYTLSTAYNCRSFMSIIMCLVF